MPTIIKNNIITESEFSVVWDRESISAGDHIIIPVGAYLESPDVYKDRSDVGVWLDAGEDVEDIKDIAGNLPVIALNFPAFTDGRAYSSANILRRKFGYKNELRAIGDVRRDQLEQMIRCGFDSFEMTEGQNLEHALSGPVGFSHSYQTSIDRPDPLFRVR